MNDRTLGTLSLTLHQLVPDDIDLSFIPIVIEKRSFVRIIELNGFLLVVLW